MIQLWEIIGRKIPIIQILSFLITVDDAHFKSTVIRYGKTLIVWHEESVVFLRPAFSDGGQKKNIC
jgi:hypothetical protein